MLDAEMYRNNGMKIIQIGVRLIGKKELILLLADENKNDFDVRREKAIDSQSCKNYENTFNIMKYVRVKWNSNTRFEMNY